MNIAKVFRSANTQRITLNSHIRYQLQSRPGDFLKFKGLDQGRMEITNISYIERTTAKGKKK